MNVRVRIAATLLTSTCRDRRLRCASTLAHLGSSTTTPRRSADG
jgi:hypothetical protein